MSGLRKTVVIFGGSGFVGRYVARRMARLGWYVRVAVRRPNEALFVRTYGEVGQVEPVLANVRDEDSTRAAISGTDAVINCVGLMQESGKQNFEAVHVEAAGRIARLALSEGAAHLVHLSALSADEASESRYASSKARGEAAVKSAFPDAMILRPSVVFGFEDHFFNRFARLARYTLVLPLVGAETMFQPVYVGDVAGAAE
ncbi:MAG: complex I NDUFA9 subunit family protein, partial [Paracoccaceae bacterium]